MALDSSRRHSQGPRSLWPGILLAALLVLAIRELRWRAALIDANDAVTSSRYQQGAQRAVYLYALSAGDSVPVLRLVSIRGNSTDLRRVAIAHRGGVVLWSGSCATCRVLGAAFHRASQTTMARSRAFVLPSDSPDSLVRKLAQHGEVLFLVRSAVAHRALPLTPAIVYASATGIVTGVAHGHLFRVGQLLAQDGVIRADALDSLRRVAATR